MKSIGGMGKTLAWHQPHDEGASPWAWCLARVWQHGAAHETLHPGVPGTTGMFSPAPVYWQSVGSCSGVYEVEDSTSATRERGEMGRPALPKQRMVACHPQWGCVCADRGCAHNSVSMCGIRALCDWSWKCVSKVVGIYLNFINCSSLITS